jgi:hypothetical protein
LNSFGAAKIYENQIMPDDRRYAYNCCGQMIMVALVKNRPMNNTKWATRMKLMPSMVCPVCENTIPFPHVLPMQELTRYGIKPGCFFDWCFNCNQGVQKNEFLRDGVWILHKWRLFTFDAKGKLISREWVIENELPVPIVIVGPGGDYDKSYFGNDVFDIFTNFLCRVVELQKKRPCSLSVRNLHA